MSRIPKDTEGKKGNQMLFNYETCLESFCTIIDNEPHTQYNGYMHISLENVSKTFEGGVSAVENVSLEIERGEFLVLLGPSGSGKSTLLRLIAGLEKPTSGSVLIGGKEVKHAGKNSVGVVFQNSALLPFSAHSNIALGLKLGKKKFAKKEIDQRVNEAAELLGISDLLSRNCVEMSGGQRGRVALARALAVKPDILLLDEPLGSLDVPLKAALKREIAALHEKLKTTFIYVTHDQSEAMGLAQRIALINEGRLQQVGSPQSFYDRPENKFVAGFIGSPPINFFNPQILGLSKENTTAGLRPQNVFIADSALNSKDFYALKATVSELENLGAEVLLHAVTSDGASLSAVIKHGSGLKKGDSVSLAFNQKHLHFFEN